MTNDEAKFILNAYRPGGQDSPDSALAEAMRQAQGDPALSTWWARSQAFDGIVSGRLREVAPPAGLREAILAGARLSRPKRGHRPAFGWWALAAALVLFLGGVGYYHRSHSVVPGLSTFAQFALADAHAEGHMGDPDQPLNAWLTSSGMPLDQGAIPISLASLESNGCRSLRLGGRRVFEVCFGRGGVMYHLYVLPRADPAGRWPAERVELTENDGAAAAWADQHFVYALATQAGAAMLQRVL